jgi:hypothetical protein
MQSTEDVQRKLVSVAMQIMDLCSPVSRDMIKKHLDEEIIKHCDDPVRDYARLNMTHCKLEMDDDTFSIVQKIRETIVLLEVLRKSELLSELQIYPIVIECNELLELLQEQKSIN